MYFDYVLKKYGVVYVNYIELLFYCVNDLILNV